MKTQQNLQLLNAYSTNNVGDAAIYASIFTMAKELGFKQFSFKNKRTNLDSISRDIGYTIDSCDDGLDFFQQYLAVGGDIFNNSRPSFITKQFLKNVAQLMNSPDKTSLFGQSIPRSCKGLSFFLLAQQMKKLSQVCVRDEESFKRLRAANVNAHLSYDTVFASLPVTEHLKQVESLRVCDMNRLALISLRSFDSLYPQDSQRFIDQLVKLIQRFKNEGLQAAILLQSQVSDSDSDLQVIKQIQKYTRVDVINPFVLQNQLPRFAPWQIAQAITVLAKVAVGVRYHTSIFRLTGGKMPFNLYYSNKGEDLSQRLRVPGVSVAEFSVDAHFDDIMKTANQTFDAELIASQVRSDFAFSLGFDSERVKKRFSAQSINKTTNTNNAANTDSVDNITRTTNQ